MDKHALTTVGIALVMVLTGAFNTLAAKWTDKIKAAGYVFDHPFFQADCMMLGEFGCLLVCLTIYYVQKWKREFETPDLINFNPFLFAIPAVCDITGTSLQYIGLTMTTASSYQMLRGSVIIFTGLLSVLYLKTKLLMFHWFGMFLVTLGLITIGICDMAYNGGGAASSNMVTGDILIVSSQILHAVQLVAEQAILQRYDVQPLLAVGLEGAFGFSILSFMLIPMYFIRVTQDHNPGKRLEDALFAWEQIKDEPKIAFGIALLVISIAFFNFSAVTTTKRLSATTRMVLDSIRTLIIWSVSIPLFGEQFIPLQILGFAFLILGMFIYNDVFIGPKIRQSCLPYLDGSSCALFCSRFWGVEHAESVENDDAEPLILSNEHV